MGGANGLLVVIERIIQNKSFYKNVPNVIKYGFTMLVVLLLWQCFRWSSIADIFTLFGIILGTVEYYGAAEPPVRCGVSHLSGLTEPPVYSYSA